VTIKGEGRARIEAIGSLEPLLLLKWKFEVVRKR
jgi:hypothetical protein